MADSSYAKSLIGGLAKDVQQAFGAVFTYILANLKFGAVEHQTRATNFQCYYLNSTTHATANTEFSIAHGLGQTPHTLIPVLALDQVGAQIVPLTVSRAADANRVYLTSSSTSAAFSVLVE